MVVYPGANVEESDVFKIKDDDEDGEIIFLACVAFQSLADANSCTLADISVILYYNPLSIVRCRGIYLSTLTIKYRLRLYFYHLNPLPVIIFMVSKTGDALHLAKECLKSHPGHPAQDW